MSPAKITAVEKPLRQIFHDDYLFTIPIFQRPYSWTTEHTEVLLDDLVAAQKHRDTTPYFLGSIVLIKNENEPDSSVVDGQQRLTTLTILLCVLRDLAGGEAAKDLDEFIREGSNRFSGTKQRPRLTIRSLDQPFFSSRVQERGATGDLSGTIPPSITDTQGLIAGNVRFLHGELAKLDHAEREQLANFLLGNCYLVVVQATDEDSAFRVFSVMNDRGLDLSPTDILKARVIGGVARESQETYSKKWETIEERLGRDRFLHLFTHVRMIYREDKLRGTIQREFQEHILPKVSTTKFVDDVIDPYSEIYLQLVEPSTLEYSSSEGQKLRSLFKHLGALDNADWIPPAMAFLRRTKTAGEVLNFVRDLDRLAYSLFILRANINARIDRYRRILQDIREERDLFRQDGPLQLADQESEQVIDLLNGDVYSMLRVRMPLLLRLDSVLAGAGAHYEHRVVTVEHVLPQNPPEDSEWCRWFEDIETRKAWCHRLANLVLLSRRKNAQASNYGFAEKKEKYFVQRRGEVTTFALTTGVLSEDVWTPAVLEQRQKELIAALKREWKLG